MAATATGHGLTLGGGIPQGAVPRRQESGLSPKLFQNERSVRMSPSISDRSASKKLEVPDSRTPSKGKASSASNDIDTRFNQLLTSALSEKGLADGRPKVMRQDSAKVGGSAMVERERMTATKTEGARPNNPNVMGKTLSQSHQPTKPPTKMALPKTEPDSGLEDTFKPEDLEIIV